MDDIQLEKIPNGGGSNQKTDFNTFNIRNQMRKLPKPNAKKFIFKHFPILDWLPKYTLDDGISDLIAGVTVGLTIIPQGIAYALVANLPAQYGLYSAFMACFLFVFLGGSKDLSIGPEAVLAILTLEVTNKGIEYVILLTFLSGIIILLLAILRLGLVIDFMSVPVNAGFTSAAAITIASSQVGALLGIQMKVKSGIVGFVGTWVDVFKNFDTIRAADTILGLSCIILLLLMRELKGVTWFSVNPDGQTGTKCQTFWRRFFPNLNSRIMTKSLWIFSISSNAIIVIASAIIAFACDPVLLETDSQNTSFILTGNIEAGLPPFTPPFFSLNDTQTGEQVSLGGMIYNLGSSIIVIPLISILANVAIAKSFSQGKPVDASLNMFALGICNLVSSFVRSMPITSSFSRSAVNAASGVKTPMSGIYTGSMVLLALVFMMPYCAYIPKASLAAVIIAAVIFMVDYQVVKPLWKSNKVDFFSALVTFLACLLWNLAFGILVGVGVQLTFVLYGIARPKVQIEEKKAGNISYLMVSPDRALVFPSVSYIRSMINKTGLKHGREFCPVVLNCLHISAADFTATKGFQALIQDFDSRKQPLVFFNLLPDVGRVLLGHNFQNSDLIYNEEQLELLLQGLQKKNEEKIEISIQEASNDPSLQEQQKPDLNLN